MRGIDMDYNRMEIMKSVAEIGEVIRSKGANPRGIRLDKDLMTVHSDYVRLQQVALGLVTVDDHESINLIDRCAGRVSNALARLAEGESCGG
jgi:hypothetical protein